MTGTFHATDPAALRAMAHPLRLQLIGYLRQEGPQPVTALAAAFDVAPGSVSYHLGVLAKQGIVEPAPELARDGRERWWRSTAARTGFEPSVLNENAETRAASLAFRRRVIRGYSEDMNAHIEAEPELPRNLVEASTMSDAIAHLTPEQLAGLTAELDAVAARWAAVGTTKEPGSVPVRIIYAAFPQPAGGATIGPRSATDAPTTR